MAKFIITADLENNAEAWSNLPERFDALRDGRLVVSSVELAELRAIPGWAREPLLVTELSAALVQAFESGAEAAVTLHNEGGLTAELDPDWTAELGGDCAPLGQPEGEDWRLAYNLGAAQTAAELLA